MNNPIQIYNELRETYLKYISSGIPFFNEYYNEERNSLISEQGAICQPPIIEIVPKYKEYASLEDFCKNEGVNSELADFVQCGLFFNDKAEKRRLYLHQYNALKEAAINRKNIVVTTGTGSGKTECFLLPIFADLISESRTWDKTNRPRAMRAMILYPLNALAEDQMIRLRKALNGQGKGRALDWLDRCRGGNRFFFGRYTGSTPVSGRGDIAQENIRKERKQLNEDWKAAQESAKQTGNSELLYHVPCMDSDSAEMWDRLSMQQNAPDILITNYSMLNVMLMRDIEAPIFEETKKWLKEDPSHVFHLVIDELHTYRGTAGTEVAYLIRILLDRLGLTPDSPQVQFLASSASMGENEQTKDFLCEFFGVSKDAYTKKFCLLSNEPEPAASRPQDKLPIEAFVDYTNSSIPEKERTEQLFASLDCSDYIDITRKYHLVEWLKFAMTDVEGRIIAQNVISIAAKMGIKGDQALPFISSFLKIICQSKEDGNFVLPLRAHFFFRSVNGLWACSNPACSEVKKEYQFDGRTLGRFYRSPRTVCSCGHAVLELIICESCGEAFLGGYIRQKDNRTFLLSVDRPIGQTFYPYAVLWQGSMDDSDATDKGWVRVNFDSVTGIIKLDRYGTYWLHRQEKEADLQLPNQCPQCGVAYRVNEERKLTPLKPHRTGLQKVNQVLADSLIRSMKNAHENNTKVVLFSDSRQSAAKLSAGIELDHYRDAVRWLMLKALKGDSEVINFLKKFQFGNISSREDSDMLTRLYNKGTYIELIDLIRTKDKGWLKSEEKARLDTIYASIEDVNLENITADVFKGLLNIGMNPAGPRPSLAQNPLSKQESVHGNFGTASAWNKNKTIVATWIQNHESEIESIIQIVTRCTDLTKEDKDDMLQYIQKKLIDRITEIANSSEYTQTQLSERLANAGMLPMFGFPTRTRNLYLQFPDKLPATDVVNRDMELALNSFAPGHEIVKDKKVYRAVGVADYGRKANVFLKADSLNILRKPLFRCQSCAYSTLELDSDTANCPVCGNPMERIEVCSPLGYCVDYDEPVHDFNGSYDWYSPNSEIRLDCEASLEECNPVGNLYLRNNVIPTQGLVHLVNDNNGKLYHMGQYAHSKTSKMSDTWVARSAYPQTRQSALTLFNEKDLAFVVSKSTGVMTIALKMVPRDICLNPLQDNANYFAIRAAYYSWGYLIRKAIACYLDIDTSELDIGYHISVKTGNPEVFIVEKLENGSGYCNYLSGRKYAQVPTEALLQPLLKGGAIYDTLCTPDHMRNCISSCYDCIRDYSNQQYHMILDWRLGLDLSRMAADKALFVNFDVEYWKDFMDNNLDSLLKKKKQHSQIKFGHYFAVNDSGVIKGIIVHPFWSDDYITDVLQQCNNAGIDKISIFELTRTMN